MKYAPPIGSADPNAGYVDRNGATPGSPVPAAAIEPVMREIENVIVKAGLMPSGSDLTQLWQAIAGRTRIPVLSDFTLYVRPDGNDANTGLTNDAAGAFRTPQGALEAAATRYDMRGHRLTISLADGTYPGIYFDLSRFVGALFVDGITSGIKIVGQGQQTVVDGTSFVGFGMIGLSNFRSNGGSSVVAGDGAIVRMEAGNFWIGGTQYAFTCGYGGTIRIENTEVTLLSGPTRSVFYTGTVKAMIIGHVQVTHTVRFTLETYYGYATAAHNSTVYLTNSHFINPEYVTGKPYAAYSGGCIDTNSGGANYFPGNTRNNGTPSTPGTVETGGVYV